MDTSTSTPTTTSTTLFEDIFEISALNTDGFKFEGVNRLQASGATFDCELLLDINCDIYDLRVSDQFTLVLASTLHLDGSPADHGSYIPQSSTATEPSLADNYEYVMHGRIFRVDQCRGQRNWQVVGVGPVTRKEIWGCVNKCGCDESIHKKMDNQFVIIAISFGGLLMRLVGAPQHLTSLTSAPDQRLYLLMKKD